MTGSDVPNTGVTVGGRSAAAAVVNADTRAVGVVVVGVTTPTSRRAAASTSQDSGVSAGPPGCEPNREDRIGSTMPLTRLAIGDTVVVDDALRGTVTVVADTAFAAERAVGTVAVDVVPASLVVTSLAPASEASVSLEAAVDAEPESVFDVEAEPVFPVFPVFGVEAVFDVDGLECAGRSDCSAPARFLLDFFGLGDSASPLSSALSSSAFWSALPSVFSFCPSEPEVPAVDEVPSVVVDGPPVAASEAASAELSDPSGDAQATPAGLATADPIPRATANAPIRPTCLAYPIALVPLLQHGRDERHRRRQRFAGNAHSAGLTPVQLLPLIIITFK